MRHDVQEPDWPAAQGAGHHPRPHQPQPQPEGQGGARQEGDQLQGQNLHDLSPINLSIMLPDTHIGFWKEGPVWGY